MEGAHAALPRNKVKRAACASKSMRKLGIKIVSLTRKVVHTKGVHSNIQTESQRPRLGTRKLRIFS